MDFDSLVELGKVNPNKLIKHLERELKKEKLVIRTLKGKVKKFIKNI
jgi:hypothetical protein